jgi:hypothetical protein
MAPIGADELPDLGGVGVGGLLLVVVEPVLDVLRKPELVTAEPELVSLLLSEVDDFEDSPVIDNVGL